MRFVLISNWDHTHVKMDYRSILNFVNSPGAEVQHPSPCSSDASHPSYGEPDPNNNVVKATRQLVCGGCCIVIRDRWILKVGDQPYHMACLRCSVCLRTLDNHTSCFIRDNAVYCQFHYAREYGTKCTGCSEYLMPSDWIQRARDLLYHVTCFRCYVCKRQLLPGETVFAREDFVVCYDHREASLHVDETDSLSVSSIDSDSRGSDFEERPAKRVRTADSDTREHEEKSGKRSRSTFTQEQLQTLQAAFAQKAMPSGDELEMIAHRLGLTKKVVCIWFQNARARNRRIATVTRSGKNRSLQ